MPKPCDPERDTRVFLCLTSSKNPVPAEQALLRMFEYLDRLPRPNTMHLYYTGKTTKDDLLEPAPDAPMQK